MTDDAVDADRRALLDHFTELRHRLVIMLAVYFAAVGAGYAFAADIYAFLVRPLAEAVADPAGRRLIYTGLTEAFFTYLKLAMFTGFFLAFPVLAAQGYAFVAPGLYARERKAVLPYLAAAPLLFLAGAALCYYYIFPMAWRFFLSFESGGAGGLPIQLEARVSEYLGLSMHLMLAFGISFQLPLVLALLVQSGFLRTATLRRGRRYAVVIIAAASAVITPPDLFSMVALMLPLYALYEASIVVCGWLERRRPAAGHA